MTAAFSGEDHGRVDTAFRVSNEIEAATRAMRARRSGTGVPGVTARFPSR